jgi:hypothetical protein
MPKLTIDEDTWEKREMHVNSSCSNNHPNPFARNVSEKAILNILSTVGATWRRAKKSGWQLELKLQIYNSSQSV